MRVVGYVRVSTEEQARSGAGLAAQRAAIQVEVERRSWTLVEEIEDAGFSARDLNRPGIRVALELLRQGDADALVVSRLDRLSRSLLDFAGLMDTARKEGWGLVALDLNVDTTTPAGEAVANVMATFAHLERRLIGQRTRDALEQRRKAGVRLGRPRQISVEVESSIRRYRDEGLSLASIAERLTADGVRTVGGGSWRVSTLHRVLSRPMDLANQTSAD